MADGLYPTALLVDEMKSEDTEARIASMKRLRTIALTLGPERCRMELIPFLNEQVEDDDEVLLVMAEELGGFVDLVGGPEHSVCLMEPLGALATVEETVVRDQAVKSANVVCAGLDDAAVVAHVLPVIRRLTNGDWFTARVSACGLFATAYSRLTNTEAKTELRTLFASLCNDDTPMVRRAAAKNLGGLAPAVEEDVLTSEVLLLFNQLAGDDQDSVRLLAIENCTAFAKVLSQENNHIHILPLVRSCAEDKSWRVRNNVAKEFFPLSDAMGADVATAELLPFFVKLLKDPEAEVRGAATKNLAGYFGLVGSEQFVSACVPVMRELAGDLAQNVRIALSSAVMSVVGSMSAHVATTHIVPLVMQFLRDEAAEVRQNVLEKLDAVVSTCGAEVVNTSVLPVISTLVSDPQWRVRERVIGQFPLLAQALGVAIFEEKLLLLYLSSYHDQVNAVRLSSTQQLEPLCNSLGAEWTVAKLVPKLCELFHSGANYQQRITILYALKQLCCISALTASIPELVAIIVRGAKDDVPNVRFVAAQFLADVAESGTLDAGLIDTEVKPVLTTMTSDEDSDVSYYSTVALERVSVIG